MSEVTLFCGKAAPVTGSPLYSYFKLTRRLLTPSQLPLAPTRWVMGRPYPNLKSTQNGFAAAAATWVPQGMPCLLHHWGHMQRGPLALSCPPSPKVEQAPSLTCRVLTHMVPPLT